MIVLLEIFDRDGHDMKKRIDILISGNRSGFVRSYYIILFFSQQDSFLFFLLFLKFVKIFSFSFRKHTNFRHISSI